MSKYMTEKSLESSWKKLVEKYPCCENYLSCSDVPIERLLDNIWECYCYVSWLYVKEKRKSWKADMLAHVLLLEEARNIVLRLRDDGENKQ